MAAACLEPGSMNKYISVCSETMILNDVHLKKNKKAGHGASNHVYRVRWKRSYQIMRTKWSHS